MISDDSLKGAHVNIFGKPLRLAIVDLDGVVLDLIAKFQPHMESAAAQLGLPVDPIQEHMRSMAEGESRGHPLLDGTLDMLWPGISSLKKEKFTSLFLQIERESPLEIFSGADETLRWLRRNGVYTALATNNSDADLDRKLRDARLDPDIFDAISTASRGFHKPDAQMITSILEELRVSPEETIFVGDWYPDIECARNAGVEFVGVLSGALKTKAFLQQGVPLERLIPSLVDLPRLVVE